MCVTNSISSGRNDKVSLKSSLFLANTIWWRFLSHYLFNQHISTGILSLVSRNTVEREGIRIQSIVKVLGSERYITVLRYMDSG